VLGLQGELIFIAVYRHVSLVRAPRNILLLRGCARPPKSGFAIFNSGVFDGGLAKIGFKLTTTYRYVTNQESSLACFLLSVLRYFLLPKPAFDLQTPSVEPN
jgi:hypothetical protein